MALQRLSVALGLEEATVLAPGVEGALVVPASLPSAADDPAPALLLLFARIQEALAEGLEEGPAVRVRVALLPPLCDARLIPLPPLKPDEMQAVLRRDAARHFLGSGRPLVVAGERVGNGKSDAGAQVLAVAAPRALVEALQRAVEARGWELERIVPAHGAWLHALGKGHGAGAASPSAAQAAAVRAVVAVERDTAHVLRTVDGSPERIRRLPAGDPAAVAEALGAGPGSVLLLADGDLRAPLAEALAAAGWVQASGAVGESARLVAARNAGDASPELVPTPLAWARRERSRRTTVRMVAAAIVTVAAAAVVHLLGTVRDYRSAQQERAEIRDAVTPALAARDSLDLITQRVEQLQSMGREAARWTFSLVEISVLLPSETHLISLRAAGDTAVIEAEGGHAGDALEALRTATTLQDVRIEGTIQREIEDGSAAGERFTLSAVLSPPSKAPEGAGSSVVPEEGTPATGPGRATGSSGRPRRSAGSLGAGAGDTDPGGRSRVPAGRTGSP